MPEHAQQIVTTAEKTEPKDHGLPGANGTLKELKGWVLKTFGRVAGRGAMRRVLRPANLSGKKVQKLLGKARPETRAAHVQNLLALFVGARDRDVTRIYVDEVHVHRDLDLGYTWGRKGERLWRKRACPKLSDRMSAYGAYDLTNGQCLLWQNGWCNGEQTVQFLRALVRWRSGPKGRRVVIGDDAPCHVAKIVTAGAKALGVEVVKLPGYGPDGNPIERLWDWMREEVTRGECHASVAALIDARQVFIADINRDPIALVDRLGPKFELDPEFEEKLRVST